MMDILGYIGYAILIFEAITGIMYVRRRAAGFPVVIMVVFFVISSLILWIFGINKVHAWWLIPTGFVLKRLIVKVPAPVYPVSIEDLKGILGEWAKVSFFSPIVISIASLFACIVRIGISPEKIRNTQQRAAVDVIDRLSGSNRAQLIQAAKDGDLQTVQTLLANATDTLTSVCPELSLVNAMDNDGKKALGWAAYKGHTEIAKLLLEKGADVNAKTEKGTTTLMLAAELGNIEMSKLLLENNVDVNAKATNDGETALMLAALRGHTAIVNLLLEKGAEVNIKNIKGATALLVAAYAGHTEVVKALLEKGADVDASADNGATALWVAAQNGHTEVVKLLLERNAKVNAKTDNNATALWAARKNGHTVIAQMLEKAGAEE